MESTEQTVSTHTKGEIEAQKYLKRLVAPHTKVSKEVTNKDLDKVVEEVKILYNLCYVQNGLYLGAYAMHHSQIEDKDPMSFFVIADKRIIINPKIVKHSNYTKDSKEQCMSFAKEGPVIVQRWQKIELEYQTIMTDPEHDGKFKLSDIIKESLSGFEAFIMQHEIDHGNAKFIYQLK
jgi:peptide deformylase